MDWICEACNKPFAYTWVVGMVEHARCCRIDRTRPVAVDGPDVGPDDEWGAYELPENDMKGRG